MSEHKDSKDLLEGFGSAVSHKINSYVDLRVSELHTTLEQVKGDDVTEAQGAIRELRRMQKAIKELNKDKI